MHGGGSGWGGLFGKMDLRVLGQVLLVDSSRDPMEGLLVLR